MIEGDKFPRQINNMNLFKIIQRKPGGNKRFVSEQDLKSNLTRQMNMTPQTLLQLRKYNVAEEKELKLEFFFYTDTMKKAEKLAGKIEKLKYEVKFGKAAGNSDHIMVTGWTTKIKMSESTLLSWTKKMCEIGYAFDCDFDGWGTNPDQ